MSDLKTTDNDLVFENNELVIVTGREEVAQRLLQRLQTFFQEWFLDTSNGVPYYQDILIKNPNDTLVAATLKTTIKETPGVIDIVGFEFTFDRATRSASLQFTARSADGDIGLEVKI